MSASSLLWFLLAAAVAIVAIFLFFPSSSPSSSSSTSSSSSSSSLPCASVSVLTKPTSVVLEIPNRLSNSKLRLGLSQSVLQQQCSESGLSLTFPSSSRLKLRQIREDPCHIIHWAQSRNDVTEGDEICILLERGQHLYGGAATFNLRWPSSRQHVDSRPFFSTDLLNQRKENRSSYWGSLIERFWITADGFMIAVDDDSPLYVAVNEDRLCLKAKYGSAFVHSKAFVNKNPLNMQLTVCRAKDIKSAHKDFLLSHLGHALDLPDLDMLRRPIWSTWARYRTAVDQEKVLNFAKEIESYGFSHSVLEIDDKYSPTYGDFSFDDKKFPNATAMVSELHKLDFQVTVWITPFANNDSIAFEEGKRESAWVTSARDAEPAMVTWWQGQGALLDVTSPAARKWFQRRLDEFKKRIGLDGFKFDAGESDYWPEMAFRVAGGPRENINDFATLYAKMAGGITNSGEVRVGHRSQVVPLFLRMFDKQSKWAAEDNGLRTLIPHALLSSLLGYSYVMPDMIGGNAYDGPDLKGFNPPDRELYVRWLQITAFLPTMQFSITPWDYDDEVVAIAKEHVRLHDAVVYEHLKEAAMLMLSSGAPIIRPLWWIDPTSDDALKSEDQFLIGDCLLVAPVVYPGRIARDIYIPTGHWRDGNSAEKTIITGPRWIRDYPAPLSVTPWFECV